MAKPTTPVAGARAGRYLFVRQITTSYAGALWEARCEADGGKQFLALTRVVTLPVEMDAGVEECLASAAWDGMELDGEGIARVAEVVFEKGWFAIVHDHYDGDTVMTLQRRITERKSAFPVRVALRILLDAVEAAQSAYSAAKDLDLPWRAALHPGSLFVCDDGRTRLLDGFMSGVIPGIPNMVREADTLAYAAPEQFQVGVQTNQASDVFALGILAWELLSSKRFHVGSRQVMERRLQTTPSRVDQMSRVGKRASHAVADAVSRALSNEPGQRFESLQAFAAALRGGDDGVASQQEVIEFSDALAGRESTLARLLMDKPPRLSDELRAGRPQARHDEDGAKDAKAEVRKKGSTKPRKKAGRAPDAMFKPTPAVANAATGKAAVGPALFGAKAAETAARKTTRTAGAPTKATNDRPAQKYGSPLAPPLAAPQRKQGMNVESATVSPAPRANNLPQAPRAQPNLPPVPAAAALASSPAVAPSPEARPVAAVPSPSLSKPRNRFSTLIGLNAEQVMASHSDAARAAAPEADEAPREPDSGITGVHEKRFDDADEEPTTIFRIGDAAANAQAKPAWHPDASIKSPLDLEAEEQELETHEYTQDMLAEALKQGRDEASKAGAPALARPSAELKQERAVAARAAVPRAFSKPVIAAPTGPVGAPLPAPNPPPLAAPAAMAPAPATAGAPSTRLPAPSSPGFERPSELPALEHSGPAAVLPALKPAVLPSGASDEAAAHGGQATPTAAVATASAPATAAAQLPLAAPASVKRYRLVALFFAGTTLLMAAMAVALFFYARSQTAAPAQAPVPIEPARPVAKAEPPKAKSEPTPAADAALQDEAKAAQDSAEQEGSASKRDDGEGAETDAEGKDEAADADKGESEAEAAAEGKEQLDARVAPRPARARASKPRRRAKSKPKQKSTSTRYVPTDI